MAEEIVQIDDGFPEGKSPGIHAAAVEQEIKIEPGLVGSIAAIIADDLRSAFISAARADKKGAALSIDYSVGTEPDKKAGFSSETINAAVAFINGLFGSNTRLVAVETGLNRVSVMSSEDGMAVITAEEIAGLPRAIAQKSAADIVAAQGRKAAPFPAYQLL